MRALLLVVLAMFAMRAQAWPTASEAIDRFLRFETAGGRMQAWPMHRYLAPDVGEDESGWDTVSVVRSWHVDKMTCEPHRCIAEVRFVFDEVPAQLRGQVLAHAAGSSQLVSYSVRESGGQWMLGEEAKQLPPFVTPDALRRQELLP